MFVFSVLNLLANFVCCDGVLHCISHTHAHTHHCCCSWFLVVWAVENKALAGVLFQGASFNECLLAFQQLFIISTSCVVPRGQ